MNSCEALYQNTVLRFEIKWLMNAKLAAAASFIAGTRYRHHCSLVPIFLEVTEHGIFPYH